MKTDNRPLRNQDAAYCPVCQQHTEQTRGNKRGERHCWACGADFTLQESRKAQAAESAHFGSEQDERDYLNSDITRYYGANRCR